MERGTVIICRFDNSWSSHVGLVVGEYGGVTYASVNSRGVPITPENVLSVVGITAESILAAQEHGRWMIET